MGRGTKIEGTAILFFSRKSDEESERFDTVFESRVPRPRNEHLPVPAGRPCLIGRVEEGAAAFADMADGSHLRGGITAAQSQIFLVPVHGSSEFQKQGILAQKSQADFSELLMCTPFFVGFFENALAGSFRELGKVEPFLFPRFFKTGFKHGRLVSISYNGIRGLCGG